MAANNPVTPKRDGRTGHDQNKNKLKRDIGIAFDEFGPIVETISLLQLDEGKNGRLLIDFIKLRHIMAHKRIDNIELIRQVCAFVIFCRKTLGFTPTSHEPQSTEHLPESFARMADFNVLVCAKWFLFLEFSKRKIVRWMNNLVKKSSFADLTFIVQVTENPNGTIFVTGSGREKEFDLHWLDELEPHVMNSPVTYTEEEVQEFKDCIMDARALMDLGR